MVRDLQNGYTLISLSNGAAGIASYKLLDELEKAISKLNK
jgi:hypothetical protein